MQFVVHLAEMIVLVYCVIDKVKDVPEIQILKKCIVQATKDRFFRILQVTHFKALWLVPGAIGQWVSSLFKPLNKMFTEARIKQNLEREIAKRIQTRQTEEMEAMNLDVASFESSPRRRAQTFRQRILSSGDVPEDSNPFEMATKHAATKKKRGKAKKTQMDQNQATTEARRQINQFLTKPKTIVGKSQKYFHDPVLYHTQFGHYHQDLSFVALRYYSKIASSIPSERSASHMAYLTSKHTNRLGISQIDARSVIRSALRGSIVSLEDIDTSK